MNDSPVSSDLDQFFGAYFHEDWDLEAEEWEGVVDGYVRGRKPGSELLKTLAEEIENLRSSLPESMLRKLMLDTVGVDYDPQPLTYTKWLGQVAERLRCHAAGTVL